MLKSHAHSHAQQIILIYDVISDNAILLTLAKVDSAENVSFWIGTVSIKVMSQSPGPKISPMLK